MRRAPTALYWCGNVVIDRRGDELAKVLVCVHAVTMQHRGEAGSLDEEVAIASTPSSVRLVCSLHIHWVDGIPRAKHYMMPYLLAQNTT